MILLERLSLHCTLAGSYDVMDIIVKSVLSFRQASLAADDTNLHFDPNAITNTMCV